MTQIDTRWPIGNGEMAERIRDFDWSATPLGPIAVWSERLKVLVELMLSSPLVSTLACGPQRLLVYNDAAARHYGNQHPAALGQPLPDTFPKGWATVAPYYARAFVGETVQVRSQPLDTRGEGTATDIFDALLTPVRESDGSVAYVHMTGAEVGDRTRIEAALLESETRHRLLIESWAQAVWESDADGGVVSNSPSWRAYTGQTLDEWLGHGWLDAIHPDDRAYAERQWREAIAARGPVNAEFRLRAPDGGWRWTNVRAAPLLNARSRIEKWVGINIDIDARKCTEAALRESEEKYRTLFETMGQGFAECEMVRDAEGRALDVRYIKLNPSWERLTGLPVSDLRGRTAREVVPGIEDWWIEMYDRVVTSGTPERIEHEAIPLGRCYEVQVYPGSGNRFSVLYDDITERKRAEATLRMSEERQSFLLQLADALRPLVDPAEIQDAATRVLGEHLGANRVAYVHVTEAEYIIERDYVDGVPSMAGRYPVRSFGQDKVADYREGRTRVVRDTVTDVHNDAAATANFAAVGVRAGIGVPLIKEGRFVATLVVHMSEPRNWIREEVVIVEETAERTWAAIERARAETALRESEARFQQFAKASAAGLWIREAETLAMEFVSPAVGSIYGVEPGALLGAVERWAALIVPEDRATALEHLEGARHGEVAVYEFRIQRPSDGAFRWIRNTNFPLRDDSHISRIGGIVEDVSEAKLATEHAAVLLAELQHRVRNIMALLRSITNRTGERAESVPEYRNLMMGRLLAFARVQALLTRTANVSVGIASIVQDEVSVQAEHEGQYVLDGPDIALSPKAAEVLTLAIHELATNAVKYGALSVPTGRVTVRWSTFEKRGGSWLAFDWTEEGAPARPQPTADTPRRRGFGSELIEGRIPYELRGRGKVTIEPGGARCHLEFPLQDGASILETDAPQRATVFGGTIDMTGEPDLTGRRILVVEDDYYLATDTARALRGAGAEVMGPYATEEDARAELNEQRPDAAVVDINLGRGPSFKLAETLKDGCIPFVFTTGYDVEVIPAEFDSVERLQKPLELRHIVGAITKLMTAA